METNEFVSERISKTAVILLESEINTVFPLFGAFEERKWAKGWNPVLISPEKEIMEEGMMFKTPGNDRGEKEYFWQLIKYEIQKHLVQYLVFTEKRTWTITVKCESTMDNRTSATITYTFIGLNESGNKLNKYYLEAMYEHNLADWEEEINGYLDNSQGNRSI